jgi:hypothetical protein
VIGERPVGNMSDDDISALVKRASNADQAAWDALVDR